MLVIISVPSPFISVSLFRRHLKGALFGQFLQSRTFKVLAGTLVS